VADNPKGRGRALARPGEDRRARLADDPRETIEEQTGRPYDLQQLHVNLVTLSGHIDEDDDQLTLSWKH
jgi:hypothetical protein